MFWACFKFYSCFPFQQFGENGLSPTEIPRVRLDGGPNSIKCLINNAKWGMNTLMEEEEESNNPNNTGGGASTSSNHHNLTHINGGVGGGGGDYSSSSGSSGGGSSQRTNGSSNQTSPLGKLKSKNLLFSLR